MVAGSPAPELERQRGADPRRHAGVLERPASHRDDLPVDELVLDVAVRLEAQVLLEGELALPTREHRSGA